MTQTHRVRSANRGYLSWSILGGAAALRIPWGDIVGSGPMTHKHRDSLIAALDRFEDDLDLREEGNSTLPALPTPNAVVEQVDNSEYYAELARRVADHVQRTGGPHS